jgi:hypothetical protein
MCAQCATCVEPFNNISNPITNCPLSSFDAVSFYVYSSLYLHRLMHQLPQRHRHPPAHGRARRTPRRGRASLRLSRPQHAHLPRRLQPTADIEEKANQLLPDCFAPPENFQLF